MRKKKKLPKILASILGVFAICGLTAGVASVRDDVRELPVSVDRKESLTVTNNGVDDYLFSYNKEPSIYITPDSSAAVGVQQRNVSSATFTGDIRLYRGVDEDLGAYWAIDISRISVSAPTFGTLWSTMKSDGALSSGWEYFVALAGGSTYNGDTISYRAYDVANVKYAYITYSLAIENVWSIENLTSDVTRQAYGGFNIYFSNQPKTDWDTDVNLGRGFGGAYKTVTFNKGFATPQFYKYVESTWTSTASGLGSSQVGRRFPLLCLDFSLWSSSASSYDRGYQAGYDKGYSDGDSVNENMATIFSGIIDIGLLPINVFLDIFNFEVFGINFKPLVAGLLTALVAIIIFRMFVGKGGGGGD